MSASTVHWNLFLGTSAVIMIPKGTRRPQRVYDTQGDKLIWQKGTILHVVNNTLSEQSLSNSV